MCQAFKLRETRKPRGALDGVDETKNLVEDFSVVCIILKFCKIEINRF